MRPTARKLIAKPLMIWSARKVDRPDRVQERHRAAREDRRQSSPSDPRVELVGGHDPEEGAHQHHPLEPDVDDAGALREHAAERAEDERRREAEHRREERRPDDDRLELADRRARGEVREAEAEQRRGDRVPAEALLAPA